MIPAIDFTKATFVHSFKVFKSSFKYQFPIAFALGLAEQLLINLSPAAYIGNKLNPSGLFIGIAIVLLLLVSFTTALLMVTVINCLQNQQVSLKDQARLVLHRFPALIGGSFLFNIGLGVCAIFFRPLALVFGAFFFLYLPILLFDKRSLFASFADSAKAARNHFLTAFIMFTCCVFIYYGPKILIPMLLSHLSGGFGVDNVLLIFATAVSLPINNAIIITLYSMIKHTKAAEQNKK